MKKLLLLLALVVAGFGVTSISPATADAQCYSGYGYGYPSYSYYGYGYPSYSYGYGSYSGYGFPKVYGSRTEIYYDDAPMMSRVASSRGGSNYASRANSGYVQYPGDVTGWSIYNDSGSTLGRVDRVIMSGNRPGYLLMSGDFDNARGRLYPVPWNTITRVDNNRLYMNMDSQRFANAPSFEANNVPDLNQGRWSNDIRSFYGSSKADNRREFKGSASVGMNSGSSSFDRTNDRQNRDMQTQMQTSGRVGSRDMNAQTGAAMQNQQAADFNRNTKNTGAQNNNKDNTAATQMRDQQAASDMQSNRTSGSASTSQMNSAANQTKSESAAASSSATQNADTNQSRLSGTSVDQNVGNNK